MSRFPHIPSGPMSPWLAILLVLLLLTGVMAALRLVCAHGRVHPETSRKAVHIVMGLVTLTFPWLFRESWPVLLLAGLAVGALAATRLIGPVKAQLGEVLHGVERRSLGEIYFPLAVAALFLLSDGNRLLYVVPLLTLTLADAVAALIGVRYGRHRYATSEGTKSAEGSLAFFVVAFLSAEVPMRLMSETGLIESLLIATVLGILVMLFEAVSVGGIDNLFIPLGCYGLLRRYLTLQSGDLVFRLIVIFIVAALVFACRRRTTLKDSGLLAAALVGYMNWALGGWQWFAVSLLLFLTYTRLWPTTEENSGQVHTVRAVASVAAPGMVWLLVMLESNGSGSVLGPFAVCYASHSVMVGVTQLGYATPDQPLRKNLVQAVFRTWLVFLPVCFLPVMSASGDYAAMAHAVVAGLLMTITAMPLLAAVGILQQRLISQDEDGYGRWIGRGLLAFGASFAVWAVFVALFSAPALRQALPALVKNPFLPSP